MFEVGELAILNEKVGKGLPQHVGDLVIILRKISSSNYAYDVELANGDINPVKESELNKLNKKQLQQVSYIIRGNTVIHSPSDEDVRIMKVDYLHSQAEIDFLSGGSTVVGFDTLKAINEEIDRVEDTDKLSYFAGLGLEVGKLVDEKQKAYGDSVTKAYEIMKVLLKDYHDEEKRTYTIPESLLEIMLLDVRKIDKLNRRFSNPDGDLMGENPFKDDVGYSLLGMRMVDQLSNK